MSNGGIGHNEQMRHHDGIFPKPWVQGGFAKYPCIAAPELGPAGSLFDGPTCVIVGFACRPPCSSHLI
jgi:hypothetical protein